jgi:Co/Zn/Cd efflux system component
LVSFADISKQSGNKSERDVPRFSIWRVSRRSLRFAKLFKDSDNLILQAVPAGIDSEEVEKYLSDVPGVEAAHDFQIWAMSTIEAALTVHVVKPDVENDDVMLAQLRTEIYDLCK